MPRYSDDKKEYTIKLRINEETRMALERKANSHGISMSEYVRKAINKAIHE